MHRPPVVLFLLTAFVAGACASAAKPPSTIMNEIAERYVRLVLKVGQHDPNYVDAYYGNQQWKPSGAPVPLDALAAEALAIKTSLAPLKPGPGTEELSRLRYEYLERQLAAVAARLEMLQGKKFSFDEEARRLYDAEAPHKTEEEFTVVLNKLDQLLPGTGARIDRYDAFRAAYMIKKDRLDTVFKAAIAECRDRTLQRLSLPVDEQFTIEYVTGKPWSGYNWYKGGYQSVIQVNTDLPISIDRAVDLACHEGYPGHHVYNVLLERTFVRDRGWVEFSVYPLFSPQSLIAEGSANFGIEVAFPGESRLMFERDRLYALAGLNPSTAAAYSAVQKLIDQLSYAGNEAARRYLDGEIDGAEAAAWLQRFAMMPKDRAEQRVKFFDQYRSYVINYNLGRDLVRAYVERLGGAANLPTVRWELFGNLLASPRLPSGLK